MTGDEEMYAAARYLKSRGELAGNKVVCTVLSNGGLIKSLKNQGVDCALCDVGDKNVCETMAKTGAVLGGERSGHVVFSKYESTGDGLVTAIMLMEALADGKCMLSALLKGYRAFPQISVNVPVVDKLTAMGGTSELAGKLERELSVRIIVRPSGTEQMIRVMAEGESEENCALACKILSCRISENCV